MRELDVSIVVIGRGDTFLLQQRGDDPQIGAAGLIGAFGGKIETDETPRVAGCRELSEETNLVPQEDQLRELGKYAVVSDHKMEDVRVNIWAFQHDIDARVEVTATEGSVVSFTRDEAMKNLEKMTPATRTCFETIIGKEA